MEKAAEAAGIRLRLNPTYCIRHLKAYDARVPIHPDLMEDGHTSVQLFFGGRESLVNAAEAVYFGR